MSRFKIHTTESAPAGSRPLLQGAQDALGFVPNLYGAFAASPAALAAYVDISKRFDETSFSPTERQVVLLTASAGNGCDYCVAAHSTISRLQGLDDAVVDGLRAGTPLDDAKLEALRAFTRVMVETRGRPGNADLDAFFTAGYEPHQVIEVVLGLTMKTLSNYTSHIVEQPLDDAFASEALRGSKTAVTVS